MKFPEECLMCTENHVLDKKKERKKKHFTNRLNKLKSKGRSMEWKYTDSPVNKVMLAVFWNIKRTHQC